MRGFSKFLAFEDSSAILKDGELSREATLLGLNYKSFILFALLQFLSLFVLDCDGEGILGSNSSLAP